MRLTRRTVVQSIIGGLGLAQAPSQSSGEWHYDYNRAFRLPTVYEGIAYVVGGERTLHAIDVESGTREWKYDEWNLKLNHEVTVVDGRCFVSDSGFADNESIIRMIDTDGEHLGTLPVALDETDVNPGPPLVYDGICYVQTTEALVAIDYLNEEVLWSDERCARPSRIYRATIPAIEGDTVVAQSGEALHAFDALSGDYHWTVPRKPSIASKAPVIEDGEVFMSLNGGVVCVDLATGDTTWRYRSGVIGYRPAQVPVIHGETIFIKGGRKQGRTPDGVVEAIDMSGGEPSRRWIATDVEMTGEGTISNGTYVDGDDQEIRAIEIETGEGDTVYVGTSNHHSVLLAAGYLFIDQTALTAIELEDLEEEYGSRGYNASNAHHDGWAERAALKVASLEMNTAPDAPRIGDELTINVTAQLESGIEATVTDDSTLEVNALGSIDENGTIRVEDSGEMTLAATFGGQTTNRTITVPAEETTDDGHNSDEDASPSGGIIGIATAIGGTAYWLSRQSEAD